MHEPMIPAAWNGTPLTSGRSPPRPPSNSSSFPSSSTSTLSPLAPPFTVDRPLSAVKRPFSIPSPPAAGAGATASECMNSSTETKSAFLLSKPVGVSAATMAPYVGPSRDSMWCSFSSTDTATLTSLNSNFGSVKAAAYYPYYSPVSNSLEDPVPLPDFKGYGAWTETIDFEEGMPSRSPMVNSWIDPSQSCDTAESFSIYDGSFGSWHGAHNDPSTVGHVGSESTDWLNERHLGNSMILIDGTYTKELEATVLTNKGSSYFQSPAYTAVKECETVIPNSCDRYISQITSCSVDSMVHYSATPEPSNVRNKIFVDSFSTQDCNYINKHITPHDNRDHHAVHVVVKQKDHSIYPNTENKKGYIELCDSSNAVQKNTEAAGSSLTKGLSLGNVSALGQSMSFLQDVVHDLKMANSCKVFLSETNAPKLDDSLQTSSELSDQLNVAVDSPCWKGASEGRWHPFGSSGIIESSIAGVTSGFDDMVQWQMPVVAHSETEKHDTFVCNANYKDLSLVNNFSCTDQKFQDSSVSNSLQVEEIKETQQADDCGEQNSAQSSQCADGQVKQLGEAESFNCESGSTSVGQLVTIEKTDIGAVPIPVSPDDSSSSNACGTNGLMKFCAVVPSELKTSVSLVSITNAQVILQAMLSLSEVLLCHCYSETRALDECDHKLARRIIHNLGVLTGGSSQAPRVLNEPLPKESCDERGNNMDKDMKDKTETGSALDKEKCDAHHEEADGVAQDFSNSLNGDFIGLEKDPKMLLYRNLWIQTEASLCSLKHDVALVKLEMQNLMRHLKAESHVSYSRLEEPVHPFQVAAMTSSYMTVEHDAHGDGHKGSNSGSSAVLESFNRESKAKNFETSAWVVKEGDDDAPVIERFRILKDRYDKMDLCSMDEKVGGLKEHSPCTVVCGAPLPQRANKSCNSLMVMDMHAQKHAALNHRKGSLVALNDREPTGVAASHAADGSSIQYFNPKNQDKLLFSSGSGSLTSEWEHVLKDEYI